MDNFNKAKSIENLISKIADDLQIADFVYYNPYTLEWNGVLENEIWEYGDYLNISDEEWKERSADFNIQWQKDTVEDLRHAMEMPHMIEKPESFIQFKWMEDFVNLHSTNKIFFNAAINSLTRKHPFRNFKDLLLNYPDLREEWFAYQTTRMKEYVEKELVLL